MKRTYRLITLTVFSLLLASCTPKTANLQPASQNSTAKEESFTKKSTLKNLLVLGKNLVCTYTFVDSENKVEVKSTSYVSGKKFAQETETTVSTDPEKKVKSNMTSDGEYIYTWSEDSKGRGMKMKIEEPKVDDKKQAKTDIAGAQENLETEYEVNCSPWSVDQSKFVLPEGVQFTDLSEMMNNIPNMPTVPKIPQ